MIYLNNPFTRDITEYDGEVFEEVRAVDGKIYLSNGAVIKQTNEGKYFDNGLSALPAYYYEGNPLDNVGFGFVDLDNDGYWELIIGAIRNAEQDPLVFEIWTLKNGEPVMFAQSGSRNRYYLQYAEEDDMWSVAYEAENGPKKWGVYLPEEKTLNEYLLTVEREVVVKNLVSSLSFG